MESRKSTTRNLGILAAVLSVVLVALVIVAVVLPEIITPPVVSTQPTGTTGSLDAEQPTVPSEPTEPTQPDEPTESTQPTQPTEPTTGLKSTATLVATGDIMMHGPVINSALSAGNYDFSGIFTYFTDYVTSADYAVANLETTLAGQGNGYPYSGYPKFNCPDSIVSGLQNAGFDMLLTANNHSYDTGTVGLNRTQQVIADSGLDHIGTKPTADTPNYFIADINGIRIGMMCYTYEDDHSAGGKAPNNHKMTAADAKLINSFDYSNLSLFYSEMAQNMSAMESAGVDAVVMFIHWGDEYKIQHNDTQSAIAQKLCDLGIDVIIGGHPHVVQPVELLTASNGSHKTLCLYSLGNAVSNQRISEMDLKTGHTEDGMLFSITFTKYSDGTVILSDTNLLPIWVNLRKNEQGKSVYQILPLDTEVEDWKTAFSLTDSQLQQAQASHDRTMAIVGSGMTEAKEYLAQHQMEVEQALGLN